MRQSRVMAPPKTLASRWVQAFNVQNAVRSLTRRRPSNCTGSSSMTPTDTRRIEWQSKSWALRKSSWKRQALRSFKGNDLDLQKLLFGTSSATSRDNGDLHSGLREQKVFRHPVQFWVLSILQPSETQKEGEAALSLDTGKLQEEPQIHIHQNSQCGLPIESNHRKFSPTLWAKTLSRSTWSGTVQWGFGFRWIPGAFTGDGGWVPESLPGCCPSNRIPMRILALRSSEGCRKTHCYRSMKRGSTNVNRLQNCQTLP